ncbi:MAG: DNA repair protein RecN [Rhodospirillales bacterium]|nr:DNA repair protein RecN [Rhodospirillales bacterium]MCB9996674.1 DNA repair protein RecN [Rhodospirillales bacterium]
MLAALAIKNVVLIDQLTIEFQPGFCALTGETGAGKSILLDSLGLALGARSETGLVRRGQDQAQVSAEFHLETEHPVHAFLGGQGLESDNTLILRRIVKADGGSRAFINDQPVSIGLLKQAGDMLVEIHGQFDTQGLLDPKTHKDMLDDYAGIDRAALSAAWETWQTAKQKLQTAQDDMDKARAEENYLRQAVEDLDALAPQPGEEQTLAHLRERLMKRDQIMEGLNGAYETLSEADNMIGSASRMLERAGDDGQAMIDGADRASAEIREVISLIQGLSADLDENDYSLSEIDDRLYALRGQARKHQCDVDDLPAVRETLAQQLNLIDAQDGALAGLMKQVDQSRAAYLDAARKTHEQRTKTAAKLDKLVAAELPPLKLDKARFVTQVEQLEEDSAWGPGGFDRVRFLVATNPGSAPGPLNKIASGGEMSRFMLALKVVMAATGMAGSMIFDEVDSGIGGATASAVGDRLARLARDKQILVVTHAPQVAARAAHHLIVLKSGKEDVKTTVIPLDELHERREEIARMISGAEITTEARAAADKLMETGT